MEVNGRALDCFQLCPIELVGTCDYYDIRDLWRTNFWSETLGIQYGAGLPSTVERALRPAVQWFDFSMLFLCTLLLLVCLLKLFVCFGTLNCRLMSFFQYMEALQDLAANAHYASACPRSTCCRILHHFRCAFCLQTHWATFFVSFSITKHSVHSPPKSDTPLYVLIVDLPNITPTYGIETREPGWVLELWSRSAFRCCLHDVYRPNSWHPFRSQSKHEEKCPYISSHSTKS